jgi:hypothetical protein
MIGTFLLVSGIWNIIMCFITNTDNVKSTIVFKVIPFFIGLGCLIIGLKLFNWV